MQPHLVPLYLSVSAAFVGKAEHARVHSPLLQNTCYVTLGPGSFLLATAGRTATLFSQFQVQCRFRHNRSSVFLTVALPAPLWLFLMCALSADNVTLSSCYCCAAWEREAYAVDLSQKQLNCLWSISWSIRVSLAIYFVTHILMCSVDCRHSDSQILFEKIWKAYRLMSKDQTQEVELTLWTGPCTSVESSVAGFTLCTN